MTILVEKRTGYRRIMLNRPDRLNALTAEMGAALLAALGDAEADPDCRAILLTGAGRGFCAGQDLSQVGSDLKPLLDGYNAVVRKLRALEMPVVCAVNGVAAGAGVSLALLGDIVLAARSATFLQLFAPKLGLMPDLGSTFYLPRLVGTARAKGLALLGEALTAADAASWGLIWACVDDAALPAQAESIAKRFATGPTQAFQRIKAAFNVEPPRTLAEQLAHEAVAQAELGDTEDFAEGVQAFRNKRAPNFTGK